MLTSLVCFAFAYGSMLRVLLPAACGRRLLVRLRRALLALSDVPAAAAIGCMNIAGDATFGDRNAPEDPDVLQEFQRRCSLQRGQADRRRKHGCCSSVMAGVKSTGLREALLLPSLPLASAEARRA